MSIKSKIHDMNPQDVFDVVRQHGIRNACAILHVGTRVLARFLETHHFDNTPLWAKKHVLEHYIANGFSAKEMAEEFKCNPDTVYRWLNHFQLVIRNRSWTAQEEKYLRFMAYQEPWHVIAERLNRSILSVQLRTRKLKIKSVDMIGYSIEDITNDVHMTPEQIRVWHHQLGLKFHLTESTKRITINPIDFHEWLVAGNIFRIEDITKCAYWLKEIYANAMHEYISTKEINYYANHVMDYAARQPWPERVVPLPIMYIQRNGIGRIYKREELREWLKHYRYMLPRRITPQMPNYLWWRDFASEWDHYYIYRNEVIALIGEYEKKIGWLQKAYNFPKSTDSMHGWFVRADIIKWIHTTGMYKGMLEHL